MNRQSVDSVAAEIANEKAEALGLAGKKLDDALRALRELDASAGPRDGARRETLVARAVERLLGFLVQREAQGLRDASYVFKFYAVPAEIVARLGIRADTGNRQTAR